MTMRIVTTSIAFLILAPTTGAAEPPPSTGGAERTVAELQAGNISAHSPPDSQFMTLLQRDVRAYLLANKLPSKIIAIEPLRKGGTQTGVSYPKYYLWIRATDGDQHIVEGAMRVAAIEQVRFKITDFMPVATIRSDPAVLGSIYPALLIPAIRQHAAIQ